MGMGGGNRRWEREVGRGAKVGSHQIFYFTDDRNL